MDCSPPCSSVHRILHAKTTGMGCCLPLQEIFMTQGLNLYHLCLLHWQADAVPLSHQGIPSRYALMLLILLDLFVQRIRVCAVLCLVAQLCLSLCNPMDYSPPGSLVLGILQERILQWVVMPSSRGSSQPRDRTQVSPIAGIFFTVWTTTEARIRI